MSSSPPYQQAPERRPRGPQESTIIEAFQMAPRPHDTPALTPMRGSPRSLPRSQRASNRPLAYN
eukprot:9488438-Pyramimonas_sp.AAC.1